MALITEARLRNLTRTKIPNPYLLNASDKLTPAAKDFLREKGIEIKINNDQCSEVLSKELDYPKKLIPVGASNRHIHLSPTDIEVLFGKDYTLTTLKDLSQPGQYAAKETVTLIGPKGIIQNVRVLGPARSETQIEISKTDGFKLGVHPPVRLSGSIENTPGITVVGPNGATTVSKGVIVAKRHVHMSPKDAKKFNVKNDDELIVKINSNRPTIFTDVTVRINEKFVLDLHVDMDEANASGIKTGDAVQMIGKNGEFLL